MAKAAIFDKDGVIVNSTRLHFEKWKRTFSKYNKILSQSFMLKNMAGRSARENIKLHLDPLISSEDLSKVLEEQLKFMFEMFHKYVILVPGILNFLKNLKKNRIPAALATSSRKETMRLTLDKFNLHPYFQSVISADEVLNAKPHPEIYLAASKKLKIKPQDCVVFEDSYSGVEAAKKARMKVILVMTSHSQKEIPDVDMAIKDFTQISVFDLKMI